MYKYLIVGLITMSGVFVGASESNDNYQQLLTSRSLPTAGIFIQEKYFRVLKKPVVSSGEFKISESNFELRTLKPISSAVILNQDKLFLENVDGARKEQANAQVFVSLLQSLISGDESSLKIHFDLNRSQQAKGCIELKPLSDMMQKAMTELVVCDAKDTIQVHMTDTNKVKSHINIQFNQR